MPVGEWLGASWGDLVMVVVSTVGIYVAIIVYTRVAGLRSFSKMSSFDFGVTVAFGSVMAAVAVSPSATLAQGLVGLGMLYLLQVSVGILRRRFGPVREVVDNRPRLLMAGTEILEDNLKVCRVTHDELRAKLRESNVVDTRQILAVVMESSGDIAVMHGPPDGPDLDRELLRSVIGAEALAG